MEKTLILANSGNDIQSRIDWLETILIEAVNQGENLWDSPYVSLLKLPSLSQAFIENIEKYLPKDSNAALASQRNQIISDLARIECHTRNNGDLASFWLATLFGCFLTLEYMSQDDDNPVIRQLHRHSLDLLYRASTFAA